MAKKKPASPPPTFEESIAQLERVVGELESGNLGLAESLSHYEAGVKHLKSCYLLLEQADRKIELLSGVDASGNPISEPFTAGEEAARDEGSSGLRSRKRTATGSSRSTSARVDEEDTLF